MAVDTKIPLGSPGVAEFKTESLGGPADARFGEGVQTTKEITITASGADLNLALYSVVGAAGLHVESVGEPLGILQMPVTILDGQSATVPVAVDGHWNMDQLTWDASYNTDALKKAAFEGSTAPGILISKPKHNEDAIY